jgi:hypothetical protein
VPPIQLVKMEGDDAMTNNMMGSSLSALSPAERRATPSMTRWRAAAAAMEHVNGGVCCLRIDNGWRSGGSGGGGSFGNAAAAAVLAVVLEERQLAWEASATLLLLCEKQCSGKVLRSGAPGGTFFCSWEHFFAPGSALVLPRAFFLLQ